MGAFHSRIADWPAVSRLLPAAWIETSEIGENPLSSFDRHHFSSGRRIASQFKTAQPGHAGSIQAALAAEKVS